MIRKACLPALALAACLPACDRSGNVPPGAVATSPPVAEAATCPPSWRAAPPAATPVAAPDGEAVVLHVAATGTQDYACAAGADGGSSWTFVGPEAELYDCKNTRVGRHFAADGGATTPAWRTDDGSQVVGHKVAAFTPDGGAASVPWLLLQATAHEGGGPLGRTDYVERVDTDGGVAPATPCAPGATARVPYSADYYFLGK